MRAIIIGLLLVAPLFLTAAQAAASESFGVSPVQLTFVDPPLTRGGGSQGTLRVQNGFAQDTSVDITTLGDLATWVRVEPSNFVMAPNSARLITVHVAVPNEAANGDYSSLLRIRATDVSSTTGTGAGVNVEVLPKIVVKVGGEQVVAFTADSMQVYDSTPQTPLSVAIHAINTGNVNAVPSFELTVENEDGKEVLRETLVASEIRPGSDEEFALETKSGLPPGSYTARLTLAGMTGPVLPPWTFEVLDEASSGPEPTGEFVSFARRSVVDAGTLTTFTAHFKNTGLASIRSTKLTVEILRDGVPVDIVRSETLRTMVGSETVLDAYYKANEPGNYVVRGYVTYDGVKSATKDDSFVVMAAGPAAQGAASGATQANTNAGDAPATANDVPATGLLVSLLALFGLALVARRK